MWQNSHECIWNFELKTLNWFKLLKHIINYLLITSKYPSLFSEIYRRYINWQRSRVRRFTFVVRGKNKPKKYYSSVQNSASREEIFPLLKGRGWSVGWERKDVMLWRNKLSKLYAHSSIKVRDRLLMVWFFFNRRPIEGAQGSMHEYWMFQNVSFGTCLCVYFFPYLFYIEKWRVDWLPFSMPVGVF